LLGIHEAAEFCDTLIFASFLSRIGVDRRARGVRPDRLRALRVTRDGRRARAAWGSADQASRTAATTVRFFGRRAPDRARRPSSHPAPPPSSAIRAEPGRPTHNRVSGCWACSAPSAPRPRTLATSRRGVAEKCRSSLPTAAAAGAAQRGPELDQRPNSRRSATTHLGGRFRGNAPWGVQVVRAVRHELGQPPQSVPADDG
jgi:hypothetical protein